MKNKIYIPQPIAEAGEEYLRSKGYEIFRGSGRLEKEAMKEDVRDCEAMILRTAKVDREILEAGKKLKIVARHGAGYDNLDWKAAEELGIRATYSPDTTGLSVAEYTLAAILNLAKRIKESETLVRTGRFKEKFSMKGSDVSGKTLGIVGLGKIGKEVARRAALGFDMRVITYVPRPEGKEIPDYVELVSWEELFKQADYISLHVPGGKKNQCLVRAKEFALMKQGAYLIQVSRGGVVDETAFADAVKNGQIAGGAVDVFTVEPPQEENPLFELENVILTPHIGSNTEECMDRIALDVAEDVHLVLSEKEPRHPIR